MRIQLLTEDMFPIATFRNNTINVFDGDGYVTIKCASANHMFLHACIDRFNIDYYVGRAEMTFDEAALLKHAFEQTTTFSIIESADEVCEKLKRTKI